MSAHRRGVPLRVAKVQTTSTDPDGENALTMIDDRLALGSDPALADVVATTSRIDSPLPPVLLAATRTVLAEQVHATTARGPRAAQDTVAPARRRRRVTLIAAPVLAAAMASAVAIAGAGGSPAPARELAWSPVAQLLPAPAQVPADGADASQSWTTACAGDYGNEVYVGTGAAGASARASHHVLLERRGDSTLCVDVAYGDGTPEQPTVAMGGLTVPHGEGQYSYTYWEHEAISAPTGGDVSVLGGDDTAASRRVEAGTGMLYGAMGPQVSGVDVVLRSGQRITASVHDGIWAAWWPSDRGRSTGAHLVVTTEAGQRTVDATAARVAADDVPPARASEASQASTNYTNAVTRKIVVCLQGKGYPAVLEGDGEMTDGAGRTSLYLTVPGFSPDDDPAYRTDMSECTSAAETAVPSPPS